MSRRYTLTNETTAEKADYTNKKNAARRFREWTSKGNHVTASVWDIETGRRIDAGHVDAITAITK